VFRKLLYVSIIILSLDVSVQSQVRCGFIGGMNISSISSTEYTIPNLSSSTSGSFGGVFDITLNNGLSLYLVPMYIEKGAKLEINYPEAFSATLNLSFFELPVFLKYSFGAKFRPYVFTGPTLAMNIASNIETKIEGFVFEIDASNLTNSVELGFTIGSGLSFMTEAVTLFVEGRYSMGLSDISKSGSENINMLHDEIDELSIKLPGFQTSGFQLLVGFALPFNGAKQG